MRNGRTVFAAATVVGVLVIAPGAVPAQPGQPGRTATPASTRQAACDQPYEPWFQASTYPEQTKVPELGESILLDTSKPDTDGDGKADTIVDASNGGTYAKVTITRGDGVLTITPGSHQYVYGAPRTQPGDLDGDGRDELILGVDQQGEEYLLPGTTPPGTHGIDDVGIFLEGLGNGTMPAGDQDGDGADDVLLDSLTETTVYSGAEIMAAGPGGTIGTLTPIATYDGGDAAVAQLDSTGPPTLITGVRIEGGSALTVHSDPPVELVAHGVHVEYTGGVGTIGAYRDGDVTYITVSASDRSGSSIAVWNLTDPCSTYVAPAEDPGDPDAEAPAEAGTEAPPATPVEGTAGYTG